MAAGIVPEMFPVPDKHERKCLLTLWLMISTIEGEAGGQAGNSGAGTMAANFNSGPISNC